MEVKKFELGKIQLPFTVKISLLVAAGIGGYWLLKRLPKALKPEPLQPITTTELTNKPTTIPQDATILNRMYTYSGAENVIKQLQNQGINVVRVATTRKGRIFVIDPKVVIWLSADGKTAYAEFINYV